MVADVQALHSQNEEIARMERVFAEQKAAFGPPPHPPPPGRHRPPDPPGAIGG